VASTGYVNAGTAANINTAATAWENPTYALTSNNLRATVSTSGSTSDSLALYNFGFSLPDSADINSITVEVEGYATGGTINIVVDKDATDETSDEYYAASSIAIGTSTDATGELVFDSGGSPPITELTGADVNATNFGVRLWKAGTASAAIDCVRMSIDYTPKGSSQVQFIGV
jgi:hypothetical protein